MEALKHGRVEVAYARVMLVGPGGVGKSSLLNGLRNLSLPDDACSTQLADTFTLRPTQSYWAKSKCGGPWVKITDQEEIKELAQIIQKVQHNTRSVGVVLSSDESTESESGDSEPSTGYSKSKEDKFTHSGVKAIIDEVLLECPIFPIENASAQTEVYLRVWDCGGQPVFLNLLPAFLTARTLYILMFDARYDLQSPCLHLSHFQGRATEVFDEMATLELMVQWMSTIHATLSKKGCSLDEASRFPRILPVGTHGDDESVRARKDDILKSLSEMCANKSFTHLLLNGIIADNTTAGSGKSEDPAFQIIRNLAEKFAAEDLAIDTPITWVLFRKVFERYSRGKPVVPLDDIKELARACLIPEDTLSSVLAFYHDLSVFFHYPSIPSLASQVIADPQWLIEKMAKIMALEGFEEVKNDNLWKLLREDGILVEPLYCQVLGYQDKLAPQAIMDLLEHFLIIAPTLTNNKHKCPGREYFVPSMLPCVSNRASDPVTSGIQSADPLHLIFSTNYLPPGFFPRLATVLSQHPCFKVDFSSKLYRNEIKFLYGSRGQQVDKVTVAEGKSSVRILVERILQRPFRYALFPNICHKILKILGESSEKVKREWFPGIDLGFAFECSACRQKDHFVDFPALSNSSIDYLSCQKDIPSPLTDKQKCWLEIQQDSEVGHDITDYELHEIAGEVKRAGKVAEMCEALEKPPAADVDATTLLGRWQKELKSMGAPPRPHLMYHLARMGMKDLHAKLLYKEFVSEKYWQELQTAKEEIDRLQRELRLSHEVTASQRDQELQDMKSELQQLKLQRLSLEAIASQRDQELQDMKLQRLSHEATASQRDQELQDMKLQRLSLEATVSQRDQELQDMKLQRLSHVSQRDQELQDMKLSHEATVSQRDQELRDMKSELQQLKKKPKKVNHKRVKASQASSKLVPSSSSISEDDFSRVSGILQKYSRKWRQIGQGLGFKAHELEDIQSRPSLFTSAPSSYLEAMLSEWQQWAPSDERGSCNYATLDSLRIAVDKAGLGLTSQEL